MKTYNFEQGTAEWFEIRKGKLTGSHAQEIGNTGKGLETYLIKLMAEYYSSGEQEQYTNKDIERGNELEAQARDIYELENDVIVEQVGFIEYNDFVGCSPDGLVGDDGGIEIKCLNDVNYFKHLINGEKEIESKHLWQIQMNLLITGRKWFDYIAYNPNYKHSIFTHRIEPDQVKVEKLLAGFKVGIDKIKLIKKKYENKNSAT